MRNMLSTNKRNNQRMLWVNFLFVRLDWLIKEFLIRLTTPRITKKPTKDIKKNEQTNQRYKEN